MSVARGSADRVAAGAVQDHVAGIYETSGVQHPALRVIPPPLLIGQIAHSVTIVEDLGMVAMALWMIAMGA